MPENLEKFKVTTSDALIHNHCLNGKMSLGKQSLRLVPNSQH